MGSTKPKKGSTRTDPDMRLRDRTVSRFHCEISLVDGQAMVRDPGSRLESGRLVSVLRGHRGGVRALAVSPDGTRAATGSSPGVLLAVDNDNGKLFRVDLSGDTGVVTLLATGLDNPTTVALHDGDAFVVESQFDHFFGIDSTPPDRPFRVKRVWLHP